MKSGDKVICIDATPLPNVAPRDCELDEYLFPDGYIEEGAIYCIKDVFLFDEKKGLYGVFLVGKIIIFRGGEIGWCSHRFRKLEEAGDLAESQSREVITEVCHD